MVFAGVCLYAVTFALTRLNASASFACAILCAAASAVCAVLWIAGRARGAGRLVRFGAAGMAGALLLTAGALSCAAELRFRQEPAFAMAGEDQTFTGTVREVVPAGDKSYYIVRADSVSGESVRIDLVVFSMGKFDAAPDDRVTGSRVVLRALSDAQAASWRAKGVFLAAYGGTYDVTQASGRRSARYLFFRLRAALTDRLREQMRPEHAAVATGLLLGDTSQIGDETLQGFRDSGISHLFAVSGLHLTVWTAILFAALSRFGAVSERRRAAVCACFVLFFMALTGFGASVVRAGIMLLITYGAAFVNRRYDGLSALFAALGLMLLREPFAVGDVGLTLSFLTTCGFLLYAKPVSRLIDRMTRRIRRRLPRRLIVRVLTVVIFSVLAAVFTMPAVVAYFGRVSVVAPLANLLCALPAELAMLFSGVAALAAPVAVIAKPCVLLSGLLIRYLLAVTRATAGLPGASAPLASPVFLYLALLGLAVVVVANVLGASDRRRLTALLACAALFYACAGGNALYAGNSFTVQAVPAGDGLCVLVENDGLRVLIGCTGTESYHLEQALRGGAEPALVAAFTPGLGSGSLLPEARRLCPHARFLTPEDGTDRTVVLDGNVVLRYINRDGLRCVYVETPRGSCFALGDPGAKAAPKAWLDADVTVSRKRAPAFLRPTGFLFVSGDAPEEAFDTGTDGALTFTASPLGEYAYTGRHYRVYPK